MKKIITTAFLISSIMLFTHAQSVDEIINKHIVAMGGKEKMMSLKSAKMTGTFQGRNQATPSSLITINKHLTGNRIDVKNTSGAKRTEIIAPTKGWGIEGESAPREMNPDKVAAIQDQLDLQGPFVNFKEKGIKIEFVKKETIENTECYNLKVTYKNGHQANYFLDSKSYLVFKRNYNTISITYTDYKKTADGFWFPHTIRNTGGGILKYERIETNIAVDNKIFEVDEGVF